MLLVKFLNFLVFSLIIVALYNLFFGIDSKRNFLALQDENSSASNLYSRLAEKIKTIIDK